MAYRDVAILRAKIEATEGTDPTAAQGDEVRAWGLTVSPSYDSKVAECSDGQGALLGATIGGARNKVAFNTYFLCPNAADGSSVTSKPEWADIALACGWPLAYTPEVGGDNLGSVVMRRASISATTGNGTSCCLDAFEDGRKMQTLGWRGGWKMSIKPGEPIVVAWDGTGRFSAPTAVAMPATSATTVDTSGIVVVGGANCLGLTPAGGAAFYPKWSELTFDASQTISEYPNGNAATLVGGHEITSFGFKGSLKLVAEAESAGAAYHANIRAGTTYALASSWPRPSPRAPRTTPTSAPGRRTRSRCRSARSSTRASPSPRPTSC